MVAQCLIDMQCCHWLAKLASWSKIANLVLVRAELFDSLSLLDIIQPIFRHESVEPLCTLEAIADRRFSESGILKVG